MCWRCRHRAMEVSRSARARQWISAPALPMQDDQSAAVLENRRRLAQFLPAPPVWLSQVHAARVVQVDHDNVADLLAAPPTADAAVTRARGIVLGVRTADCLPVLFADRGGTVIGAAHAGWRGLAAGILEATVQAMRRATARDRGVARSCHRSAHVRSGYRRVLSILRDRSRCRHPVSRRIAKTSGSRICMGSQNSA